MARCMLIIIICSCFMFVGNVRAERASMEQMTQEALLPYSRTKDKTQADEKINRSHRLIQGKSELRPNEPNSATFIFRTGLTINQAAEFAGNVPVISAHLKTPLGDNGRVLTVLIGADDLYLTDGSFEQRLRYALSVYRGRVARKAGALLDEERAYYERAVEDVYYVFDLGVVGTSSELMNLSSEGVVRGAFLDESRTGVEFFEQFTEMRRQADYANHRKALKLAADLDVQEFERFQREQQSKMSEAK